MEDLISILIMMIAGYAIRFALIYSGQFWAKAFSQTVSFFILPTITFIITKTIYGNIALSLGMIGALSIVRFRHPVKSPLELIIYFDLITIGIAASVKNEYSILLAVITVLVLVILKLVNNYSKKNKDGGFYNISFSEGNDLNQIEILSSNKVSSIEENKYLKSIIKNSDSGEYIYRLAFDNKNELNEFKDKIEDNDSIKKIDVNYI
tara:strand:- start:27 stop:647 length:621 start_codon:yes stop_codon:yes gene_type:complete